MRFCGKCGSLLNHNPLGRERRNVSVVFVDLAGFSSLTRTWPPEQLRDLADEVLTVVAGVIEEYDGYVDAFQGDGLIALFGAPHSHPDDPYRAVLAATAGLRAIESVGASKGFPLKGRAGVNTGIVIAGAIGSGRVREYTVMGSAVNLAARLEAAAEPGEVWVGPETYEATRHRALYETVGGVALEGFPNVTEVYKLVSASESGARDPYAEVRFVGRAAELARLEALLAEVARRGQGSSLWLTGGAGIGKTRLLRELSQRAEGVRTLWLEEQSYESTAVWRRLAAQLFELPGDNPLGWQQPLAAELAALLPDEPRWQRYILASLGLIETRAWRRPERRSVDRSLLAWRDLLLAALERERAAGRSKALLLIAEERGSGSALEPLFGLLAEAQAPVLVVRTSRDRALPEEPQLRLEPLDLRESLTLVEQLANPILKVATESLVVQVGGVPANLLELGRALSITPQGSFSGSLASLLQARLDMLTPSARRLLAVAALCGERSWEGLIAEVAEPDDPEALRQLLEASLLVKEGGSQIPGESEYRFQSELVRRAVLRMMPFSERPLLHLRLAAWLERRAPLSLSELVAHHFREGGSSEAAYPHYLAAADLAVSEGEVERAYELFDTLLTLELPATLLAQGALACAQAAISQCDKARAVEQLSAADHWIELASGETKGELRAVHAQLCQDVIHCGPQGLELDRAEPGV